MIEVPDLWALVEARAEATPDALAAVDEDDRRLSFAGYRDAALRCAAGLALRGVEAGTPVSWILPTWLETLVLTAALSRLGARQNPILPIYREREVGFVLRQTRARLVITPGVFRGFDYPAMARGLAEEIPGLDVLEVDRALPEGDPGGLPPAAAAGGGVRWVFYTSGTTADPKGALHTDETLAAFSFGMARALALAPDDRVAMVFPITHIGGMGWVFAGLAAGCAHVLVSAFDPATSIDVLARHGVTQATAGTAFHQAYLAAQRARPDAPVFPDVRAFPGGGAPKPPALHFEIKQAMGGAGIVSGYGMTECPILAMNAVGDDDAKLAHTEGRACPPEVEIRVVTPDGREVGPGEEGEFRVRGPQLCLGYLDSALDAASRDERGFFRTGDLGYLDDDGYLVVTGRLKDVIIRKGENISAKEVEDLLFEHPKLADVAVVGLPDPETGERACAVAVCSDAGDPLEFDEMVAYLRDRKLMVQKIPERLELVASLPRNPTGKVLKHELRARYAPA
ncbi:MAG: AMP-binding protein [Myxococcota bacterium]